mmetsp:Transcript_2609/g.6119  ORF Transcript_2609/g.6119 Transcript_2609/m.6119 type:complete len:102 (+) Transcript_2609:258-563(+)
MVWKTVGASAGSGHPMMLWKPLMGFCTAAEIVIHRSGPSVFKGIPIWALKQKLWFRISQTLLLVEAVAHAIVVLLIFLRQSTVNEAVQVYARWWMAAVTGA